jgi:GT2 family glycosyltransferase
MITADLPELDSITNEAVSIVIPVYNAMGQVEGLLTRLNHFAQKYGSNYQFILADDASTDGTAYELPKRYPFVEVVRGEHNLGFGRNANRGAEAARHEYLAFVNSDIELIGNPFKELMTVLKHDPHCFAAMPMVFNRRYERIENLKELHPVSGLVWANDLVQAEEWTDLLKSLLLQYSATKDRLRDVGKDTAPIRSLLCGALFVCRRFDFERLGGFNARYSPFYWEDVDLDYRARRQQQYCCTVPNTAVIHRHSESIDRHHAQMKTYYLRINQLRFVIDHLDQLADVKQPHIWWGLRALRELLGGDRRMAQAYWRAGLGRMDI